MTFDIEADWKLNLLCNYDCEYCFSRASTEHRLVGRISPERYLDFFDSTERTWLLHLTGGEPFFHPDFVHLCRTLTSRHYISLTSNLTSHRVENFAADIDASRVQYVHCGVHAEERDRRKGWPQLLANVGFLLERGFPVFASLVMTPSAFADLPADNGSVHKPGCSPDSESGPRLLARPLVSAGLHRSRAQPVPPLLRTGRTHREDERVGARSLDSQPAARPEVPRRVPQVHRHSVFRRQAVRLHRL